MESSCHSQSGDHENIVRCDEMYVSHDEVGFRLSGYWVLGTGYWVLGTGYWVLGTGYWVLGTGYWVPGTGY